LQRRLVEKDGFWLVRAIRVQGLGQTLVWGCNSDQILEEEKKEQRGAFQSNLNQCVILNVCSVKELKAI